MDTPMSGSKRTPLARQSLQPRIPPKAVELFNAMRRCRCTCDLSSPKRLHRGCPGCDTWWTLHSELDTELAMPPWQWPCILPPWRRGGDNEEQAELWEMLADASRQAKRAAREAKRLQAAADASTKDPLAPPASPIDATTP